MKVVYDSQAFVMQEYGGISRYFHELFKQFETQDDMSLGLPFLFSKNHYLTKQNKRFLIKYTKRNYILKKKAQVFNNIITNQYLLNTDFDLFHPTYYSEYFLRSLKKKPYVLTVHDLIQEKFRVYFPNTEKNTAMKKMLIDKASRIIAVSNHTKQDLIGLFGVNESKIDIVYHGNSIIGNQPLIEIQQRLPEQFLLFVGTRDGYKNFKTFLTAMSLLLCQYPELNIVCAGGGPFKSDELALINKLRIQKRILQLKLDDNSLGYIYSKAVCFVFPTLYEGFGIPLLEAFSNRCPVACSNTSSLPEVGGDAAVYFLPTDTDSISATVRDLIENQQLRNDLIQKGIKRIAQFSWQKTAEETKNVYQKVI